MPKRRGLKAPIKAQLRSILEDYPGGQLLSEALQNAEDSGSRSFALMLDKRQHGGAVDERLAGPAFVLIDDGSGLGEDELESLENLQDSVKRDSPTQIGRYGMGSRSFFHYSDITTLVSRGAYVGIDPLYTVKSHGRDGYGWEVSIDPSDCDGEEDAAVSAEARETFAVAVPNLCGSFNPNSELTGGRGAMFRLPLRRAHEVEKDGLGPEISVEKAEKMLCDWAESLLDSRLMLFLSSVCEIKLLRWEDKAKEPTLVAQVSKHYAKGKPSPRLPSALPDKACESFKGLQQHLDNLTLKERQKLSRVHSSSVKIVAIDADAVASKTTWLVAQRFDATSNSLRALIEECGAVPVVGVAAQLVDPAGAAAEQAAAEQRRRLDRLEAATGEAAAAAAEESAAEEPAAAPAPASDEPVVATYKCLKKSQVRAGFDMDSAKAGILAADTVIEAFEVRPNDAGVNRVRFSDGWVSEATGAGITVLEKVGGGEPTDPAPTKFSGSVFCFLPVGDMRTGLPIHVNASFQVAKNRRSLWLKDRTSSNLDGKHLKYAQWNEILMTKSLPRLWRSLLLDVVERSGVKKTASGSLPAAKEMKFLPDLSCCEADWKLCAEALYEEVHDWRIVPHGRTRSGIDWVAPSEAHTFDPVTPALTKQYKLMHELYCELDMFDTDGKEAYVVDIPQHVQDGMCAHSKLRSLTVDAFLQELFEKHWRRKPDEIFRFAPLLLALAERIGGMKPRHSSWHWHQVQRQVQTWKDLLDHDECRWVPLQGSTDGKGVPQPSGYTTASAAFLPGLSHLDSSKLSVLKASTANLTCPGATDLDAIRNTVESWGLKDHMSWDDVVAQAEEIANELDGTASVQLLKYLEDWQYSVLARSLSREKALQRLLCIAFVPGAATVDDPKRFLSDDVPTPIPSDELHAPSELLAASARPSVWAACNTYFQADGQDNHFLKGLYMKPKAEHYIDQLKALAGSGGSVEYVASHMLVAFKMLAPLLERMDTSDQDSTMTELQRMAWVPTATPQGPITRLQEPQRVAIHWDFGNLSPAFGQLAQEWRPTLLQSKSLQACTGIRAYLSVSVLLSELTKMAELKEPLDKDQLELAANLCRELAHRCEQHSDALTNAKQQCFVPTTACTLQKAEDVYISDAPWHGSTGQQVYLLHEDVAPNTGRTLGCTSVRKELARRCELHDDADSDDESFGQHEKLSDRIKSLLSGYSDRFDVFTEHWQNSDDAGAESLLFMLDLTSYPTDSLVNDRPGCCALQGPALLLASSKPLGNEDVARIQQVGNSQKQLKFESAGRFGVGINCLYSITNCPTFLANGALHVMDPLHYAVTEEPPEGRRESNGRKFSTGLLRQDLPDMLKPFETKELIGFPTVFRLALRESYCVGFGCSALGTKEVEDRLRKFAEQAQELLVFSKHVQSVKFIVKTDDGEDVIAEVKCEEKSSSQARLFMQSLPSTIEQVRQSQQTPKNSVSETKILTCRPGVTPQTSHWVVSHYVHADSTLIKLVETEYKTGLALLPHGAAALRLDAPDDYLGHLCCFMPLAGLLVGPPCLLHGCFSVAEDRKSVHPSDEPSKPSGHRWNHALLGGPVASSLALLIDYCRQFVPRKMLDLTRWLSLMELSDSTHTRTASGNNWSTSAVRAVLRQRLLQRLLEHHEVFCCIELDDDGCVRLDTLEWLKFTETRRIILGSETIDAALSRDVQNQLIRSGLKMVYLPERLRQQFIDAATELGKKLKPSILTPHILCDYLRSAEFDSKMESPETILQLLAFIVPPTSNIQPSIDLLRGVPLLLLANDSCAKFGDTCIWDYHELLPDKQEQFLHGDVRGILSQSSKSPAAVQAAAAALSIVCMTPEALLPFETFVHENQYNADEKWLGVFYQLIHKHLSADAAKFCRLFANWSVIKVTPAASHSSRTKVAFVPLRDCGAVFSLHAIDLAWQSKLGGVLLRCGIHVLKADQTEDTNRMQMIQQLVGQDIDDLLEALVNNVDALRRRLLDPETIVDLLRYFGSRIVPGVQEMSPSQLNEIRKLPLFGKLGATSSLCDYTDLLRDTAVTYVCLPSNSKTECCWAGELMHLFLPNTRLQFLAWPKMGCDGLYKALGINVLNSLEFIVQFLCPALPDAARQGERTLDPLLTVLAKRISSKEYEDHLTVIEAAKKQKFIQNDATGEYMGLETLFDPEHSLAVEFGDKVGNWLPHKQLHKHAGLLRQLGMKSSAPVDCLEHCARGLADTVLVDDQIKRQSYCLIDETCRQLSELFRLNAASTGAASSQRLLGNGKAQVELRLTKVLTSHRIAVVKDSSSGDSLKLAKFHHLLLTSECQACAGSQFETLMHEAGRPTRKDRQLVRTSSLQHLVQYYPEKVCTELKCFCDPMQLDLEVLLMQLSHQANQVEQDNVSEFRKDHPLIESVHAVLGVAEKKLSLDSSNLSVSERLLLEQLGSQPCLPREVITDAAGDLDAKKVRLVRPDHTYLRLPDGASDESEIPFDEHPGLLSKYSQVAGALNIAETPDAADWARCTTIIADRTQGNDANPNEISAVFFAVTAFLKLTETQAEAKQYKICFPDRDNDICSLLPGNRLVWRDNTRLARRCTHLQRQADLHFMREHFRTNGYTKFTPAEVEQLCKLTAVRRLSDVVRVARDDQTSSIDPSKEESCVAQLLRSVEFEDGYCACLKYYSTRLEDQGNFNEAKTAVRQCLSSLKINWANPLVTCLQDIKNQDLEDSTEDEFALVDVDGTLWLRAGVMGTQKIDEDRHDKRLEEESLLEALSDAIGKVMRSGHAPELHSDRLMMDLLKCWKRGPASIIAMLSSHDIEIAQSDESDSYHPGTIVPLSQTAHLQQNADCTFAINDIVAVSCGTAPEGIIQYKYAKVLCSKDLAQEGTSLSRKYRLNEGGNDRSVVRRHYEIFKFDRSPQATVDGGAELVSAADGAAMPDLGDEDGSEWQTLVHQLREMEDFAFKDYKKMMRRLFKQWHPDKCSRPHAAVFFGVLRRHSSSYEGDRDFSWLHDTVDAEEALRAVAAGPTSASPGGSDFPGFPCWDGPDPNEMFAEFEREQKHSDGLRRQAEAAKAAWQDSPARAAKVSNRQRNEQLSDYYWQGAENQRRVARVLAAAEEWKDAVWNAQQVVELTIKALMMRTCGITNDELRGKGAHDLTSLMRNICEDSDMWPVTLKDLEHLSAAYLKARYPTSKPTDEQYDDRDTSRALHTADQVLAWARAMDFLPPPVCGTDDEEDPPKKKRSSQPTVMDPAPVPPGPAIPQPAIAAQAPAAIFAPPTPTISAPATPTLPVPPPAPLPLWHEAPRALESRSAAVIEDICVEEVGDDDGGWGVL